jgi:hypothetical protein
MMSRWISLIWLATQLVLLCWLGVTLLDRNNGDDDDDDETNTTLEWLGYVYFIAALFLTLFVFGYSPQAQTHPQLPEGERAQYHHHYTIKRSCWRRGCQKVSDCGTNVLIFAVSRWGYAYMAHSLLVVCITAYYLPAIEEGWRSEVAFFQVMGVFWVIKFLELVVLLLLLCYVHGARPSLRTPAGRVPLDNDDLARVLIQ